VPDTGSASVLIAGVIVKLVVLVVDHVRFTVPPALTLVESAAKVSVGAAAVTLIVTVTVLLPPGPTAVAV
jgi:hypothetical protein